jgi:hypothetical protein
MLLNVLPLGVASLTAGNLFFWGSRVKNLSGYNKYFAILSSDYDILRLLCDLNVCGCFVLPNSPLRERKNIKIV